MLRVILQQRGKCDARLRAARLLVKVKRTRATLAAAGLQLEVVQTEANLEDVFVVATGAGTTTRAATHDAATHDAAAGAVAANGPGTLHGTR